LPAVKAVKKNKGLNMDLIVADRNSENWKKPFFIIWSGQAFSLLGSNLVNFALIWWMTQATGSAKVLAAATAFVYLPRIFLGPFIGALVDRWDRRRIMIIADSAIAAATIVLGLLFWSGLIEIWHVYILLFFRSLGGTFHFPAMQASTSLMVPDEHLPRISGINQMLEGGMNIAGPPLGALLLSLLPVYGVLGVDVITAALAVLPLFFVLIPQPKSVNGTESVTPVSLLQDVKWAVRYLVSWQGLLIVLSISVMANFLFSPVFSFLPLLVTEHFHGDVWHLSWIESIFGIGMIGGGLLLGIWGGFKKRMYTILFGIFGAGTGILIVGVAPENAFPLAMAGLFISGFTNTLSNGTAFAMLQSIIPPEVQGRIFSIIMSTTTVMAPVGVLVAAPVVEKYGIQSWYIFAGIATVLMVSVAYFIPSVINLETTKRLKQPKFEEEQTLVVGD
jgi:DHA3 family macrolide efflux protein-like MFS transporter